MKHAAKNTTNEKVPRRANRKFTRMNDPIRIVPLHLPSELYGHLQALRPLRPHNLATAEARCWTR